MSPVPAARDPLLVLPPPRGMTRSLDLRTPVAIPIGCPATSVRYPLESSRIAGTQNVATSTLLLMPSRLLRSTSMHCKVNPYAFAWLPNHTRLLHLCRAVRSAPGTMSVCHAAICRNHGTSPFRSQSDAIMAALSLLPNRPEILKFPPESDGTHPDLMNVTCPCRNSLWLLNIGIVAKPDRHSKIPEKRHD